MTVFIEPVRQGGLVLFYMKMGEKGSFVIQSEEVKNLDGTIKIMLTKAGKRWAELSSLDELEIKRPKKWDGNWRIVIFDIPEQLKKVRDSLHMHLRNLGFIELQKSVFIYPFPCLKEIGYIIKFYNIQKFVRILTANSIDDEEELMKRFGL
ncbi:MAG: hypothetical protein WCT19_04620 [Candidatus Paceibacterota bacterium]|jgi:DNA-binding transcriptional regulator PaaX